MKVVRKKDNDEEFVVIEDYGEGIVEGAWDSSGGKFLAMKPHVAEELKSAIGGDLQTEVDHLFQKYGSEALLQALANTFCSVEESPSIYPLVGNILRDLSQLEP